MRRLSKSAWLGSWALCAAGQAFALYQWFDSAPGLMAAVVAILQVVKVPLTAWRLYDLGRPPDDAILALVPAGNVGLWWQLLQAGSLPEDRRAQRMAQWEGQLSAFDAWVHGLRVALRNAPLVLVLAVVFGGLKAWGLEASGNLYATVRAMPKEQADGLATGLAVAVVVLAAYTLLQYLRADRATRPSWIPSLLLIPTMLVYGTVAFRDAGKGGVEVLFLELPSEAFALAFTSIVGAFLAAAWIEMGEQARKGTSNVGEVVSKALKNGPHVAAPHGAALHAVDIGMQVVIPGIHYALVYAFGDMAAVVEPDRASLARSTQLTTGIRRRIFKIYYLGVLAWVLVCLPIALYSYSPGELVAALITPTEHSLVSDWVGEGLWLALTVVVTKIALVAVYHERKAIADKETALNAPAALGALVEQGAKATGQLPPATSA